MLCAPMWKPEPDSSQATDSYIPVKSRYCGDKNRITILMQLMGNSLSGKPTNQTEKIFSTYEDLMKLDKAQALENPESYAMFYQGKCWKSCC